MNVASRSIASASLASLAQRGVSGWIGVLVGGLIVVHPVAGEEPSRSLRVTLTSAQPVVIAGESIVVQLAFTNIGDVRLRVVDLRQMESALALASQVVSFDVVDAAGEHSHIVGDCGALLDYYPGERTFWLHPQETMTFELVLNPACTDRARVMYPVDLPGTYRVTATFYGLITDNPLAGGSNGFIIDRVTSTPLTINVMPSRSAESSFGSHRQLEVATEDQACRTDDDCTIVLTRCGGCECGVPINRTHQAFYVQQYNSLCAGYYGDVCDFNCPTPLTACMHQRCVLIAR